LKPIKIFILLNTAHCKHCNYKNALDSLTADEDKSLLDIHSITQYFKHKLRYNPSENLDGYDMLNNIFLKDD